MYQYVRATLQMLGEYEPTVRDMRARVASGYLQSTDEVGEKCGGTLESADDDERLVEGTVGLGNLRAHLQHTCPQVGLCEEHLFDFIRGHKPWELHIRLRRHLPRANSRYVPFRPPDPINIIMYVPLQVNRHLGSF